MAIDMSRESNWLFLLGAFLLLGGGGYAVYNMTRGIRNHNPLNIEDDGTAWEGLDTPRNDGGTSGDGIPKLRFTSPEYGFRAGARIIHNYVSVDGVPPTVNGIIRRWSQTDQDSYVSSVAAGLGVDPDETLDLSSQLVPLLAHMTSVENGFNPYSNTTILAGASLA